MAKSTPAPLRRTRPTKSRSITPRPSRARVARAAPAAALPEGMVVVGVGASAGGLEAFAQLLEGVDADAGLTLILVQHLSPHHESALATLLAPHTKLPVTEVTDGVRIKRNHVYVIPPNVQMVLAGDALALLPRPAGQSAHTPIDSFFASLAETAGNRCIAVVLSGTASDGAVGIREVKAAGGITFAQTPASAKYDGMPRAAIGTGMVDAVLPPTEIGAKVSEIAGHPYERGSVRGDIRASDDRLQRVFELLQRSSGVDFRHYKMPTIRRRLMRRMALHRLRDVDRYIDLLEGNAEEVKALFQDLLIHVTQFFRESESFDALVTEVFPKLIDRREPDRPIRLWVCGCATGEEVYSLAIVLFEFLQQQQSAARAQIFGTDVSDAAVDVARAALYPASIAADVGPERLRSFFTRTDGHYRVAKQIREMCVFARQDLTRDPPFSRLDLIMCRNVLIYLNPATQRNLISVFHYSLNPEGHLVLGQAESVGAQAALFTLVDKRFRIHRKKSDYVMRRLRPAGSHAAAMPVLPRALPAAANYDRSLQAEVSRVILERYSPAGVVVDGELQIIQVRGQTGLYLEPAPGEASLSLLKMLREGLLFGVRAALESARKSKKSVRREDLRVRDAAGWRDVAVEVIPLAHDAVSQFLVLFEDLHHGDAAPAAKPPRPTKTGPKASRRQLSASLQRELESSRAYMQSVIQELEAANEELQSANEEILSSNEELQSTNEELDTAKEELQSTNEELNTVNDELQVRNDEMGRVNSDLVNLVGSVQIAIVIVSGDLRIRRFTPMAEKVLNLIPADLDRSIAHINPNIDCPELPDLIKEAIDSVTLIERDVRDRHGRWYALRIRPYKSLDQKIDGAVLALFDIDILKRSEQSLQRAQAFADGLLNELDQPVAVLSPDFRLHKVNDAFAALFARSPADLTGRNLVELDGFPPAVASWPAVPESWSSHTALPSLVLAIGTPPREVTVDARAVPAPDSPDQTLLVIAVRHGRFEES